MSADSLISSGVVRRITSFASATDLTAIGAKNVSRAIRADSDCVVAIKDETNTTVALPFKAGETQAVRCLQILGSDDGTTASGLTIYW